MSTFGKLVKELVDQGFSPSVARKLAKEETEQVVKKAPKSGIVRESPNFGGQLEFPFDSYPKAPPLRSNPLADVVTTMPEPKMSRSKNQLGLPFGKESLTNLKGNVSTTPTKLPSRFGTKSKLAAGAGGLGGLAYLMSGNGTEESPEGPMQTLEELENELLGNDSPADIQSMTPKMGRSNTVGDSSPMMSAITRGKSKPSPKPSSGPSGILGPQLGESLGSIWGNNPEFENALQTSQEMGSAPINIPEYTPSETDSGGKNDWLKAIGPILAALMFSRVGR